MYGTDFYKLTYLIIGAGKVGLSFARFFADNSINFRIWDRNPEQCHNIFRDSPAVCVNSLNDMSDKVDFLIITVSDSAIDSVMPAMQMFILQHSEVHSITHSSGTKGLEMFDNLQADIRKAAMHPYQTFYYPDAKLFQDIYWGIESDDYEYFAGFSRFLNGKSIHLRTGDKIQRFLYHSSAVAASNYLNTILFTSNEFCKKAGITFEITKPIIKQTLNNIYESNEAFSLTGPIARADYETIKKELEKIAQSEIDIIPFIYLSLATLEAAYSENYFQYDMFLKIKNLLKSYL